MRLRPALPVTMRYAEKDVVVNGLEVPKGAIVMLYINAIHKRAKFYPDPQRFDPDRPTPTRTGGCPSAAARTGSANPAPKLATLIAGMCSGADSIDDVDILHSGGMKTLFGGVYAPSTIGTLLREFSFGHARQLESVLRAHLAGLCERVDLLPGGDERAFIDIDSLLRPVYGHAKQGASYGHSKIASRRWRPRSAPTLRRP